MTPSDTVTGRYLATPTPKPTRRAPFPSSSSSTPAAKGEASASAAQRSTPPKPPLEAARPGQGDVTFSVEQLSRNERFLEVQPGLSADLHGPLAKFGAPARGVRG